MKTIHKYPLTDDELISGSLKTIAEFTIAMHHDAIILHFAMQRDTPTIWALVDTTKTMEDHHFVVVGTGKEIMFDTDEYVFIGTTMTFSHSVVVHLFEKVTE